MEDVKGLEVLDGIDEIGVRPHLAELLQTRSLLRLGRTLGWTCVHAIPESIRL